MGCVLRSGEKEKKGGNNNKKKNKRKVGTNDTKLHVIKSSSQTEEKLEKTECASLSLSLSLVHAHLWNRSGRVQKPLWGGIHKTIKHKLRQPKDTTPGLHKKKKLVKVGKFFSSTNTTFLNTSEMSQMVSLPFS